MHCCGTTVNGNPCTRYANGFTTIGSGTSAAENAWNAAVVVQSAFGEPTIVTPSGGKAAYIVLSSG